MSANAFPIYLTLFSREATVVWILYNYPIPQFDTNILTYLADMDGWFSNACLWIKIVEFTLLRMAQREFYYSFSLERLYWPMCMNDIDLSRYTVNILWTSLDTNSKIYPLRKPTWYRSWYVSRINVTRYVTKSTIISRRVDTNILASGYKSRQLLMLYLFYSLMLGIFLTIPTFNPFERVFF